MGFQLVKVLCWSRTLYCVWSIPAHLYCSGTAGSVGRHRAVSPHESMWVQKVDVAHVSVIWLKVNADWASYCPVSPILCPICLQCRKSQGLPSLAEKVQTQNIPLKRRGVVGWWKRSNLWSSFESQPCVKLNNRTIHSIFHITWKMMVFSNEGLINSESSFLIVSSSVDRF